MSAERNSRLLHLLAPPTFTDAEKTERATTLHYLALIAAAAVTTILVVSAFVAPALAVRWLLIAAAYDVIVAFLLVVARRGYVATAAVIWIAGGWTIATWTAWTGGGVSAPAIVAQMVVVMLAGMMLGWQAGLLFTGISILSVLGMVYAQSAGFLPVAPARSALLRGITVSGYIALLGFLQAIIVHNLSSQQRRASRLFEAERRRAERMAALKEIAETSSSTLQLRDLAERLIEVVRVVLGASSSVVALEEAGRLQPLASAGYPSGFVENELTPLPESSLAADAYRSGEPRFVEDALGSGSGLSDWSTQVSRQLQFGSFAGLPMLRNGQPFGAVAFMWPQPRQFDPDERAFLESVVATAAAGLDNARLFDAEVAARARASKDLARTLLLEEVAAAVTTGTSIKAVCDSSLQAAARHLDLRVGAVYVHDPNDDSLFLLSSLGFPAAVLDRAGHLDIREDDSTLAVRAARERRLIADEDVPKTASRTKLLASSGVRGMRAVALPLEAKGQLLGTLSFVFKDEGVFSAEERGLLESLAGIVGQALENARLFEAEGEARREAASELETTSVLLQAANELNRWTDLPSLLDALVGLVVRLVPGSRVNIGIAAQDRSSMRMAAGGGKRPYPVGGVVPWERLTSGARGALESGRTSVVDFEQLEEGGIANEYGSRLALFVALRSGDRVVGQVGVDVPDQRHEFTPREIALVEGIASQAAVAIDNARLFADQRTLAERAFALKELAEIGVTGFSVREVAERFVQSVARQLGASNAAVVLSDGERLQPAAWVGYPDDFAETLRPVPEDTVIVQAFRSREPIFAEDTEIGDVPEFTRSTSRAMGYGSFAAFPLGPSDNPLGSVGLVFYSIERKAGRRACLR